MSTNDINEKCNNNSDNMEKNPPLENVDNVEKYNTNAEQVLNNSNNVVEGTEIMQDVKAQDNLNEPEQKSELGDNSPEIKELRNVAGSVSNNNEDQNYCTTESNLVSVESSLNPISSDMSSLLPNVESSVPNPQTESSGSTVDVGNNSNDNLTEVLLKQVSALGLSDKTPTLVKKSCVEVINKESYSLRNLLAYTYDDSSSSSSECFSSGESSGSDSDVVDENIDKWNLRDFESSSSDDSESSDNTDDDVSSEILSTNKSKGAIKKDSANKKVLYLDVDRDEDCLPPVPDLSSYKINVEKEEFMHIGQIDNIIDKLVTVQTVPGTPAFDLDSCLFIEDKIKNTKKPIGEIFDVLGPVTAPLYCVRFNSNKDIEDLKLIRGTKIFVAPKSEYTKYVFVKELMKMKGSDASWLNDQEVPSELAEFSDDEQERESRKPKALKRKHGSLERHQRYEQTMNKCNVLNTRVSRLMDAHQHLSRSIRPPDVPQGQNMHHMVPPVFNLVHPVPFNPSVPPPGFVAPPSPVAPMLMQATSEPYPTPTSFYAGAMPAGPPGNSGAANWTYQQGAGLSSQGQNNAANYHTNNGRSHPAGPSFYRPF